MAGEKKLIGQLKHRVTFQKMQTTSDDQGGQVVSWIDVITVWASVQPKNGNEYFFAERVEARTDDVVIVRDLGSRISEDMRIKFRDRIMMLKSIDRFENSKTFFQQIKTTDKVGS